MRSLIIILLIVTTNIVKAQPPVRISADDFLKTIATHPEVMGISASSEVALVQSRARKEHVTLTPMEESMLELERQLFTNEFKGGALRCFQACWMLEQQIAEAKHYQNDVLSLKINRGDLLLKQEVLSRESKLQLFELENQYKAKVNELNALVGNEYGDQPVLPQGWVWSFNDDTAAAMSQETLYWNPAQQIVDDVKTLSERFAQVNAIIALQEKYISKIGKEEPVATLNELSKLSAFKTQRWEIFGQIADKKAELYKSSVTYPLTSFSVTGLN